MESAFRERLEEIAEVSEMNITGDSPTELLGLLLYIRAWARNYKPGKYCVSLVQKRRRMRTLMEKEARR